MIRPLFVFGLLLGMAFPSLAQAHGPFESSLKIEATKDALEATAVLALDSARLLLPADQREGLQAGTFTEHRAALLAAAPAVCTLLDAGDAVLPPERVLVTLNRESEIHFLILYPATARPARLKVPFLEAQSLGCFCELVDLTGPEPRRATLLRGQASYLFSPAPSS